MNKTPQKGPTQSVTSAQTPLTGISRHMIAPFGMEGCWMGPVVVSGVLRSVPYIPGKYS